MKQGTVTVVVLCDRLKRPAPRKKYGLLSNYDDSVEMEAVESDEDDTLYEARSLRRSEVNTPRAVGKCSPVYTGTQNHLSLRYSSLKAVFDLSADGSF